MSDIKIDDIIYEISLTEYENGFIKKYIDKDKLIEYLKALEDRVKQLEEKPNE